MPESVTCPSYPSCHGRIYVCEIESPNESDCGFETSNATSGIENGNEIVTLIHDFQPEKMKISWSLTQTNK